MFFIIIYKIMLVLVVSLISSCALIFNEAALDWDLQSGLSSKEISKFILFGKEAKIENNKITYTFQCDFEGSLTNVVPDSIVHSGVNIYPKKDVAVNLRASFNYLVVAGDSSSKKYEVDIKIAPVSSKEIIKFNIDNYNGEIDDLSKTITFNIEDDYISGTIYYQISGRKLEYNHNEIENNSELNLQFNNEILVYNCEDNYDTYTLKNNSSRSGSFDLSRVSISPRMASVFETFPNNEICKNFEITNPNMNSIDLGYSFSSQANNFYLTTQCDSLAANETCSISVCYLNQAIGTFNDTLIIEGENIDYSTLYLSAIVVKPVNVNPVILALGELRVAYNYTHLLNIENLSSSIITIDIVNENPNAFTIDQTTLTLAPNYTINFPLTFTPKTYGAISSNLSFIYNFSSLYLETSINVSATGIYEIGDTGPAGGKIYMTPTGLGIGLYYEAASADFSSVTQTVFTWGCKNLNMPEANATLIGTGLTNTQTIVQNCLDPNIAANLCLDFNINAYSGWFLPSQDELLELYHKRYLIGAGLAGNYYWTSSQANEYQAIVVNFNNGETTNISKDNSKPIRCVRSFSSEITY